MLIIAAIIANAFGRRFAGGLLGQWLGNIGGTQVGRLAQAAIVGVTVTALAPVWWWGLAAVPLTFLGATWGFPRFRTDPHFMLDMKASHMVPVVPLDAAGLALHGFVATLPLTLGAAYVDADWWWLLAAGLLRAPAYWLATLWQPSIPALGLNPDGIPDPPALAEFYAGGLLGLGIALALAV